MGFQYFRASKLPIIRTRAFNHTGPGRPSTYAVSGFASQFARMELGLQPPLFDVGDLSIRRDILDVRDVVRRLCPRIVKKEFRERSIIFAPVVPTFFKVSSD